MISLIAYSRKLSWSQEEAASSKIFSSVLSSLNCLGREIEGGWQRRRGRRRRKVNNTFHYSRTSRCVCMYVCVWCVYVCVCVCVRVCACVSTPHSRFVCGDLFLLVCCLQSDTHSHFTDGHWITRHLITLLWWFLQ